MKYKIFIDGKEGTTGLRIYERFQNRNDIEIITIDEDKRKDLDERKKCINMSDSIKHHIFGFIRKSIYNMNNNINMSIPKFMNH